jgi:pimeloyl-ACP methyl ester carboxylesterase
MQRSIWTHIRAVVPVALFALLLTGGCASSEFQEQAPPIEALTDDAVFEAAASQTSGKVGDVIRFRRRSLPFIDAESWLMLYRSTDALGKPISVSGTVLVPHASWSGGGPRPIIAFAHGTAGLTDDCAPSKALALGLSYENGLLDKALAKGWAVALTDYEGLGTPGNHTYVVAASEAHTVLDSVRAAVRTPRSGLDPNAPVGIWGYSQGGGAAAAAAELAPSYAPELRVMGVAAGGTTADLVAIAANLEGSLYFGFQAAASIGLNAAYPELDLDSYLNAQGKAELGPIDSGTKSACVVDLIINYAFRHTSDITTSNPLEAPAWKKRLAENKLGMIKPKAPVFLYHGDADEIIPFSVGEGLRDRWCELGATVDWAVYPLGVHLSTMLLAADDAVQWLSDRFNGMAAPNTCKH